MIATDECEHCIDEEGDGQTAKSVCTLPNGDKIYRCLHCGAMWGIDKNGERLAEDDG